MLLGLKRTVEIDEDYESPPVNEDTCNSYREPKSSIDENTPKSKNSRMSIASVIEHKVNVQLQMKQAEIDVRKKELELEERRLALQEKKDEALINLLTKLAENK